MKFRRREDLTTGSRVSIAIQAFLERGIWGAKTALARRYGVSRQMVYLLLWALLELFEPDGRRGPGPAQGPVVAAPWEKLVLALRLHGCCSGGDIAEVLAALDAPKQSTGAVSQFLNATAAGVPQERREGEGRLIALADEIFMAGRPILVLPDAKSHYILTAVLAADRSGQTWADLYEWARQQGYDIEQVAADCGEGLRKGCRPADLSHHPDLMHLLTGFSPFLSRFERRAYQAIDHEDERRRVPGSARSEGVLRKRRAAYARARRTTEEAIRTYDEFAYLRQCLLRAFDLFDEAGTLRTRSEVQSDVAATLELMNAEIHDPALTDVIRKFNKAVPGESRNAIVAGPSAVLHPSEGTRRMRGGSRPCLPWLGRPRPSLLSVRIFSDLTLCQRGGREEMGTGSYAVPAECLSPFPSHPQAPHENSDRPGGARSEREHRSPNTRRCTSRS